MTRWFIILGMALSLIWMMLGCAPRLRCRIVEGRTSGPIQYIEVCEGRPTCRNLNDGRFVECP